MKLSSRQISVKAIFLKTRLASSLQMQARTAFGQAYKQQAFTGVQVRNHLVKQGLAHDTSRSELLEGIRSSCRTREILGWQLMAPGSSQGAGLNPYLMESSKPHFFQHSKGLYSSPHTQSGSLTGLTPQGGSGNLIIPYPIQSNPKKTCFLKRCAPLQLTVRHLPKTALLQ